MRVVGLTAAVDDAVRRAHRAVYVAFIGSGFAFASWVSRIPQVRDRLDLSPAALGLLLLSIAAGSVMALPMAGVVVNRIGAARAVAISAVLFACGLTTAAIGYTSGIVPAAVGLFFLGYGNGTWDVAMNVQGAAVERRLGRPVMPRYHAGFSIGTVAGAVLGSGLVALRMPVTAHLLGVAAVVAVAVPIGVRQFLPAGADESAAAQEPARTPLAAWREPRTLLIGAFVLCMAFTEGTGNDWLGVAVIDGYHAAPALGSLAYAVFVAAMTVGRWFGPGVIEVFGRVAALRASALVALIGLLLTVFGQLLGVAYLGTLLWGLGVALGFPIGMSAAADESRPAAGRVSVVASIGYTAFLAGPPVVGFLGDHVGVLRSLIAVAAVLAVAVPISGACRPPVTAPQRPAG
ncbi:MAG: MFS transporter [Mycobacteriales bacterium]|nr:MAG: MFS transporter [Pseudonocardiales bacterium]